MAVERPYADLIDRLKAAGLRPTRQRLALGRLMFQQGQPDGQSHEEAQGHSHPGGEGETSHRHITAELLHGEAKAAQIPVSLATVYNTLHQFTQAGLLREVVVEPGRSYFDTNTDDHHHFFYEDSGQLQDIPSEEVRLARLPEAPTGTRVNRVDVIIRLSESDTPTES